jgi:hypothetical protein
MGRRVVKTCDVCRKETEQIVGKLQFIPSIPGVTSINHSNYTHHLDVGVCCKEKVFKAFNFRKRQSAAEYQRSRKAS